jgi:AraC-like DNA-binding protein
MARRDAEKAIRQMLLSDYRHHPYQNEGRQLTLFFEGRRRLDWFFEALRGHLDIYADVLAPQRLRGIKNSFICLITVLSRRAIEYGVDPELSFAISDYYINAQEGQNTEAALEALLREALGYYYDLAARERARKTGNHSRPVARALAYIERRIHRPCTVAAAAAFAKVSPNYLSARFNQELGFSPSRYIRQRKMAEAERMLAGEGLTVAETADALGYYDMAHFSRVFKQHFGLPPSSRRKNQNR